MVPLNLDSTQQRKLAHAIAQELSTLRVVHGTMVQADASRMAELIAPILPKKPKLRKDAGLELLENEQVASFLLEQIESLLPGPFSSEEEAVAITDIPQLSDTGAVAEQLVAMVLTLPWHYLLLIPTAIIAPPAGAALPLSDGCSLRAFAPEAAATLPLHEHNIFSSSVLHQDFPKTIESEQYYFTQNVTGYLSKREPPEIDAFVDAAKGFLGLCVMTELLHLTPRWFGSPSRARAIIVYRIAGDHSHLEPYHWLSTDDSDVLGRLSASNDESAAVATSMARTAFAHRPTRGAARWHLDSFVGANGLLQMVQSTVSLEILLGDKEEADKIGLSNLLANRLAYLIGKTPTERSVVLKRFKYLYDIRSQIVHGGKVMLSADERVALYEMRHFARRAILTQVRQIWSQMGPRVPRLPEPLDPTG